MIAFTPGPWHCKQLAGHNRGWAVFTTHSDAKGTRTLRLDDYRAGGELREADARLIAAAPDMAQALRGALVLLERLAPDTGRKLLNGSECSIGHYASYHVDAIRSILSTIEGK